MNGHDFFGSTIDESVVENTITSFNNLRCDITNKQQPRWARKSKKGKKNKHLRSNRDKTKIDRFIPIRDEHKFDAQQTYQQQQDNDQKKSNQNINIINNNNNDQQLVDDDKNEDENGNNNNDNHHKILSFQSKAPEAPDGYISNLRTLYTYNSNNDTKTNKNKQRDSTVCF